MFKFLASLILISSLLLASKTKESSKYQIFAKSVEAEGDYIYALGDVVVYNENYVLSADRVVYNKKTKEIELFGNVHILGLDHKVINSKYIKLNLENKSLVSSPFFFFDPETKVWIESFEATGSKKRYLTNHAIVSSCDVKDPDWKIVFKEGYLDKDTKMVTVKHATLYAGSVPVFYLPYFKFPTDKSRHSGLLRPSGGYEKEEGIYFREPLYIVLSKSSDLEIDPQIRTLRGKGIYITYRFVDSLYSKGLIRAGTFKEKYDYYQKYNLKNKVHNGFEIDYESRKLFSSKFGENARDALLVDITYLNDIDYLNLQESNKKKIFNKLVTSKINYFIEKDDDYFGVYAKYFIDTDKVSNKDTLQILPSLQYHKSIQPIFMKNLLYSIDLKGKNWYREEGVKVRQYEAAAPLSLYFSLYDDYLNFSISENLYFTYVDYVNGNNFKNGSYFSNYHKFSLSSDLLKKSKSFIHNINLNLDFIVPSAENKKGDFQDFIALNKEKKSLNFKFSQYFYNLKGENFFLHRITQSYYFDDSLYKYGDLENEIKYRFLNSEIYNQIFYSYERDKIRKSQTTFLWDGKDYYFKIMHNYENFKDKEASNYLIAKFNTKFPGKYNFFADIDYDMDNNFAKGWKIGWIFKKKCWNYKITYRESVTPSLTSEGTESITKRGVFLTLNLVPLGGIHYEFTKSSNLSEDK